MKSRLPVLGARRPTIGAQPQQAERFPLPAQREVLPGLSLCIASRSPGLALRFAGPLAGAARARGCDVVALYDERFAADCGAGALHALDGARGVVLSLSDLPRKALGALEPPAPGQVVLGLGWAMMAHFEALLHVEVDAPWLRAAGPSRAAGWLTSWPIDLRVATDGGAVAQQLGEWLAANVAARTALGQAVFASALTPTPRASDS